MIHPQEVIMCIVERKEEDFALGCKLFPNKAIFGIHPFKILLINIIRTFHMMVQFNVNSLLVFVTLWLNNTIHLQIVITENIYLKYQSLVETLNIRWQNAKVVIWRLLLLIRNLLLRRILNKLLI